mgnify:CR=1 FL=1
MKSCKSTYSKCGMPKWDTDCGEWHDDDMDYGHKNTCFRPRCKMECVKTYKCYYKLYRCTCYRLFKCCPRCGHEFDYHRFHGMCPRCCRDI